MSYCCALYYVTSQVTSTDFNVFATDFAVCLTITIIFDTVFVFVIDVTKCNFDKMQLMLSQS